jgi:NADH-quinone oxidoreductase subunit H
MADLILEASIKSIMIFALALGGFAYATWIERKFIARLQMRYGPNRAGSLGCSNRLPTASSCSSKKS